jgi:alanine racemase
MNLGIEKHRASAHRPTWIEVAADALINNVRQVRRLIGPTRLLMAVVKANAYGHGAIPTTNILLDAGVDHLAVATLAEGMELRKGGITAPILVLGYTPSWLALDAVQTNIAITVYEWETLLALETVAAQVGLRATVHVKVNTGMNRLGLAPQEVTGFLRTSRQCTHIDVEGIFTHFATSDLADKSFAHVQFRQFAVMLEQLHQAGLRPRLAHAANSAAILTLPDTYLDMVRCGIALYGLHPDEVETRLPATFRPALTWKAQVAHVLTLTSGESVSYGREFIAPHRMVVAVIPVGYADGFPRRPYHWGHVLIHGEPAPILGRVCMDQTIVDVTKIARQHGPVQQGDEVVLIGRQGQTELTPDSIARQLRTNNYDVICRILGRVPRIIV